MENKLTSQPTNAQLLIRMGYRGEREYDVIIAGNPVIIGQPETNADVCRNTLIYQLVRRKQKTGYFTGRLYVEDI